MKNRFRILKLIILISAINSLKAQDINIGVKGDIGFSKITNITDAIIGLDLDPSTGYSNTSISILEYEENNFVLSGNLGFFLEKKIGKKSSIILNCVWMQINGRGLHFQPTSGNSGINGGLGNHVIVGQPYGVIGDSTNLQNNSEITSNKEIRLNYLAVPLMYRYGVGKLGIIGGVLPMFGLSARVIDSRDNTSTNETDKAEYKLRDFQRLDLGIKAGFDYQIVKNIKITISYYHGFREIRNSEYFEDESKNRELSLGMEYIFWKNQKQ